MIGYFIAISIQNHFFLKYELDIHWLYITVSDIENLISLGKCTLLTKLLRKLVCGVCGFSDISLEFKQMLEISCYGKEIQYPNILVVVMLCFTGGKVR